MRIAKETMHQPDAVRTGQDISMVQWIADQRGERITRMRSIMGEACWNAMLGHWRATARPSQLPPRGDWRLWLMLAGRGFGKTRAGAEWVDAMARSNPGIRIALVGATQDDVRKVMIEGESGLLNLPGERIGPIYSPALRRLIWPGKAIATAYSAAEPESLRGPQHHIAWADEVARWGAAVGDSGARGIAAWDNLMMGLRLGDHPRVLATTTPRTIPLVRQLLAEPGRVVTGGPTQANAANLPARYLAAMRASYGETALGRQEINGELIEDMPGSLWTRGQLEQSRLAAMVPDDPALVRIVIGVDPPASKTGDACGIIVAARLNDGRMAVLDDASVERASPQQWASAVAIAAAYWGADRIVAEANNGGDMVRSVLHQVDADLPVVLVHARRGKTVRAEPVAIHYAQGRISHCGSFAKLEDQLCGMTADAGYVGPGRSPDRADALVWAIHALIGHGDRRPGVRGL